MTREEEWRKEIRAEAERYANELDSIGRREKAYAVRQKLKDKDRYAKIERYMFNRLTILYERRLYRAETDKTILIENMVRALF